MDEGLLKCPVCGKENKYDYYSEIEWGVVERHYYCPRLTDEEEAALDHLLDMLTNTHGLARGVA